MDKRTAFEKLNDEVARLNIMSQRKFFMIKGTFAADGSVVLGVYYTDRYSNDQRIKPSQRVHITTVCSQKTPASGTMIYDGGFEQPTWDIEAKIEQAAAEMLDHGHFVECVAAAARRAEEYVARQKKLSEFRSAYEATAADWASAADSDAIGV